MNDHWEQERALVENAALRIEELELRAKSDFDRISALAHEQGQPERALSTPEFHAWMAARHDSDAAWGRWFEVMGARPADKEA